MKISVVIPAYNCGEFIKNTIKSIQEQALQEFEVIIVNDGSTDNTMEVINSIEDDRIKVITVKNGGPARARNIGIEKAQGEYIAFLDSDDLIRSDMFEEMYKLANENRLDICACGYTMESVENSSSVKEFLYKDFVSEREEYRKELMPMIKSHLMYVVWNKLFRREFVLENNIRFIDFLSGEDRLFNTLCFKNVERFGFVNKPFYRYFLRGQASLANKYVENRFDASVKCHEELIKAYKEMEMYDAKNKAYIDFMFIKGVMSCFTQLNSKGCKLSFKQKRQTIAGILTHPLVKDAISTSDDEFSYSKKVNMVLRTNNKTLIYLMAKTIFIMQFKLNSIYLKLKHRQR